MHVEQNPAAVELHSIAVSQNRPSSVFVIAIPTMSGKVTKDAWTPKPVGTAHAA
jgi:hypothetical protein